MQWSGPQPQNSFMCLLLSHFADKKVETKGEKKGRTWIKYYISTKYYVSRDVHPQKMKWGRTMWLSTILPHTYVLRHL